MARNVGNFDDKTLFLKKIGQQTLFLMMIESMLVSSCNLFHNFCHKRRFCRISRENKALSSCLFDEKMS